MSKVTNNGRPTVMTDSVVQKLEEAFKLGANISEACVYANISRSTFYEHQFEEDFSDIIESAKYYMAMKAKAVVFKNIEANDLKAAMWYLQKYD